MRECLKGLSKKEVLKIKSDQRKKRNAKKTPEEKALLKEAHRKRCKKYSAKNQHLFVYAGTKLGGKYKTIEEIKEAVSQKQKIYVAKHCTGNPEYNKKRREYVARNRKVLNDKFRIRVQCNKYGITKEHYFELMEKPCIDHNHKTGQVRGVLCAECNRALGLLQDNPDTIQGLLNYLNKNDNSIKTKEAQCG
jgi:hypothetical protein